MNLPFQNKLMVLFIFLLLGLLLIQGYLIYFFKKSFFFSSSVSLLIILCLAYLLVRILTQRIQKIREMARRLVAGGLEREIHIFSNDEWGEIAKAVDEMKIRLREKIEEVSRERDYLQTILKGMTEGVLVVDERGRILMVNDAFQKILSLSLEVLDRAPLEAIRNTELEEAIREAIQQGKNRAFELTFPLTGGKTLEVNVVGISPSYEESGKEGEKKRGAIAVFHDISRLKQLEKIRQDFVANVSHELRTPLTTIKGYAETLLEGALKEDIALQFVQVIKRHTDRLTKIVEDLLMLSRIETKEFQLKTEVISLPNFIDDILEFVREPAEKKKISLSRNEIPSSLAVLADRSYLEQILINLLDNAIKYTPEGGKVMVLAAEKDSKDIEFSVEDNGIGIPREDLSRIFERFYRVDKGRSKELGGTGLGLSIVKHLVQTHGGQVWVESQLGKGSTFYFNLPKHSTNISPNNAA